MWNRPFLQIYNYQITFAQFCYVLIIRWDMIPGSFEALGEIWYDNCAYSSIWNMHKGLDKQTICGRKRYICQQIKQICINVWTRFAIPNKNIIRHRAHTINRVSWPSPKQWLMMIHGEYWSMCIPVCDHTCVFVLHDDVIKWKHFPRYWPFVRGIHRSPVNSPHKGQWRGALMFYLICALNKQLSKQLWGWWFETPSRSLWRHCNVP